MSESSFSSMDLYVPEYCVQGGRIPFYLLWDNSEKIKITIILSEGLTLNEVYNVNSDNLKLENNSHVISDFETKGYLGGVIGSKIYKSASIIKTVKFDICYDSDKHQIYEKRIELFRPDIKVDDKALTIHVKSDRNNRPLTDNGIKISNNGKGTAIVRINILKKSQIKEGEPEGFEEFKIKFLNDLDEAFNEVKKDFPQYDKLIDSVRTISKNPLPSDGEELDKVRITIEKLEDAFDNNEEFLTKFFGSIATAYLRNVSIMTDADAFLAFLKSVGENKLIILDAMKILKISSGSQTLNAEILSTDLIQNNYQPIKLHPITINSDGNYKVAMYQIINSVKVN